LPNQVYNVLVDIGTSQGFFEKNGVQVETVDYPTSLEASQAMKATNADTLQMTFGSLMASYQAGVGLKYFCGTEPVIPNEIMAPPGSNLPAVSDGATWQQVMQGLATKRVGFPTPDGTGFWKLWVAAMKEAGVSESDVLTVNVGTSTPTISGMLSNDGLDAAMVSSTGTQFLKDAGQAKSLMTFAKGPSVYTDLYGAAYVGPSADFIEKRPAAAKGFCLGIDEALKYVQDPANLQAAAAALAAQQGLSQSVAESAVKEVFPLFTTELDPKRIQKSIDTFISEGISKPEPVPTVDDLVADSLASGTR
jgi:ABC-type nitrate/sulfonate/bicarbonate transport system substrate-binding protein